MSKRRRSTTSEARDDDEPHTSPTTLTIKRRKRSVNVQDVGEVIQELYEIIRSHKNEEGRLVCEPLIRVPKRRSAPEYYEVVSNPIDMLKIQQRIKTEEYDTVDDMVSDVELMVNNAQAYYKKNSQEYRDANELWTVFLQSRRELLEEAEARRHPPPAVEEPQLQQLSASVGPHTSYKPVEPPKAPIILIKKREYSQPHIPAFQVAGYESRFAGQEGAGMSGGVIADSAVGSEVNAAPQGPVEESGYIVDDPSDPLEILFSAVMGHRDVTGRIVSLMFRKLPRQHEFPAYYEIIDHPIDLCDIAVKIKNKKYDRLADLDKDLSLMVKNAKLFNEPGSQIYKDAVTLKKVIVAKKAELERQGRDVHHASKARQAIAHAQSAITEALNLAGYVESVKNTPISIGSSLASHGLLGPSLTSTPSGSLNIDEDDEDDDSFSADSGDPRHVLFDFVLHFRNQLGQLLSEPFMRLPNSRIYPDYYREIKKPLALTKIRSKLKTNKYKNLSELGADLELVFKNAFQYNDPSSQLYKDAETLHRAMLHKKKELEKSDVKKEFESEDEGSEKGGSEKGGSEKSGSEKGGRRRRSGVPPWKSRRSDAESTLKTKMMMLYQTLVQYQDGTGRNPIALFMEKPSKKEYPDYYHIITEPIDMRTIEGNIRHDRYPTENFLMKDFALMFENARHYNEEGSMVYEDANLLETILSEKCKELGFFLPPADSGRSTPKSQSQKKTPVKRSPAKTLSPTAQKLNDLFNAIKDYTDQHGRELSPPFIRLPSKNEYPEYYQVIKRPMDMQRIQQKIMSRGYDQLEDMVNDFLLMFDNACKFNEPDSLIYKDALTLQRILLQTKTVLMGDETSGVPDVQGLVREILTSLFVSVANHQDEEGRCYSDSLAEIPVDKDGNADGQKKPLDLDTIRRYLDRGCYRRLDCFQDHIFEVLERARALSRTDSQVYEDSVELQRFFIQIRDEICKNGEILLSPALSYTHRHLQNDLDEEKKEKLPKEIKEDNEKKEEEDAKKDHSMDDQHDKADGEKDDNDDGLMVNGVTYRVGDFVYVEPSEKQLKNHIVCIEKLWRDADGEVWLHGNWFLRPNETFHLATRKFLEKEVFKSDYYNKVKISQHVLGKCFVMFVRDYFKNKPEGFDEDDVFVCESRYSAKAKAFKKIKIWAVPPGATKILNRDEPLSKVRIASVFAGFSPDKPVETFDDTESLPVFDKEREEVMQEMPNQEGFTYFEQVCWNSVWFKLGDCVYIKAIKGRPNICKMDKIWKDRNGDLYFFGPVFIHPSETVHPPTRLFFQNEIFLSSMETSYHITQVLGKCSVMLFKDYIASRPTEFAEKHVYVCESQYKEVEQSMRKIKGLKRHNVANKVIDDEIYFFKKPINPVKEPSPLLQEQLDQTEEEEEEEEEEESEDKDEEMEMGIELELDDEEGEDLKADEEVALMHMAEQFSDVDETASATSSISTPKTSKPKGKNGEEKPIRPPSAFILFASENRAACKKSNPDMTFGDISRIIGSEWRKLSKPERKRFEVQAAQIAANMPKVPKVDKDKDKDKSGKDAATPGQAGKDGSTVDPNGIQVYECGWDGCDYMYEDLEDLISHVVENSGHLRAASTTTTVEGTDGTTKRENSFLCCWRTCTRFKKNQPFPVYSRLVRHCKEVHMKHSARMIYPHQLSRNYYSREALHGPNAVRPSTPGSSAVMGVVGPPTPVGMATQQINQSYGGYAMQGDMYGGAVPHGGPHGSPYNQGMHSYQPGMLPPMGQPYPPSSVMHPPPAPHMGVVPPHQQQPGMMQGPYSMARGQAMSPHAGAHSPAYSQGGVPQGQQSIPAQYPPLAPPQPMFVPAPPKTQRLLHSEAYIKYIEGLNNRSETISDWKQNLTASKETVAMTEQQKSRLPRHWFAQGVLAEEGDIVDALWKMRDIMLNDSLMMPQAFQFQTPDTNAQPAL
ncbi:protein polybromo-1-like [Diadema setosum]|uniref:protein polybromo-1-like n=1 Tax=Diadema setosum TaxID=31175 RepID=UPI003B3B1289